ncbi:MAG: TonB-dependent receptor plug domain-containing protein, partial [Myxococcota bacterium]
VGWWAVGASASAAGLEAIEQLALGDLLNLEVEVATRTPEQARQAAGLVAVLTQDDLRRAGARDLADALRLLPEFELATDTWNTVGIAVRGNWAFESKVLVLIDGHEWNELDYGTFTVGNRLPAYAIDRIEVIRGPGSAVYGGYASLAVVEVTTRAGSDWTGSRVDARASWLGSGVYGRQDVGVSGGYALGDDARFGITADLGRGRRSDDPYRSVWGRSVDLTDGSDLDPGQVSASLDAGGLSAAVMVESYRTTHRDGYGAIGPTKPSDYLGAYANASWRVRLGPDWTLTPRGSFVWQQPWHAVGDAVPREVWSADRVDRTRGGLDLTGAPSDHLDLRFGVEAGVERARVPTWEEWWWFPTGPTASFLFGAGWAQGILHTRPVNVTAGVRVDANGSYGEAISPRLALTRAWDRAHAKLQLSRAFRAPGFQQSKYA